MKNPYRTLGLSRCASAQEIRRAYKSLALRHHPDVNPGDPSAEELFKEVLRAYEILSDTTNTEPKVSACEGEIDRILKRLKASLTFISGSGGGEFVAGISLGKSCLRERTTHCGKPFSPTSGFVRPTPPRPPKAPRSPVSPLPL